MGKDSSGNSRVLSESRTIDFWYRYELVRVERRGGSRVC